MNQKLIKEFYFETGKSLEDYSDKILEHKIKSDSYFETKYNLFKSNIVEFDSLFSKPFFKEIILLFNKNVLCAVFYKFEGVLLDYFNQCIQSNLPNRGKVETTHRNSILYTFSEDLFFEILVTDNKTTGICMMNSQFREDQLKTIQEKKYELLLINNNIEI
ncbi:hypothetical protein [Winogradskyella luteola]|uniref:Uncharacterized protein n=1 Tax=Winogradskyella luteola TaxID=2828330 RepID=A0A9X1FBP1_9FLAO|nr:hypothetical protein [Winogradskyella luteola]MBV7270163.1 hypothetical protein [Winogradskyella luteola]